MMHPQSAFMHSAGCVLVPNWRAQAWIVNAQQKMVKSALQKGDKRIELMNEVLSSMDIVK